MTSDEERGKLLYEKCGRGWATLTKWEDLSKGAKSLWVDRAKGDEGNTL